MFYYLKNNRGFTLIELMAALGILGILFGAVMPAMSALINSSRANTVTSNIHRILNFARMESVNRSKHVVICPSFDGEVCSKNWSEPLIVFIDLNKDGLRDEKEEILRRWDILKSNERIIWRSFPRNSNIRYREDGTTGYINGSFYYCPSSSSEEMIEKYQRRIILFKTGRLRTAARSENKDLCG